MVIDLADMQGNQILRYESEHIPKVGETISMMRPKKTWEVIGVDHLIRKPPIHDENKLDLITLTVRQI